jgi:hypothetical protein
MKNRIEKIEIKTTENARPHMTFLHDISQIAVLLTSSGHHKNMITIEHDP